jgi:PleD family two-component response regulator
MSQIKFDTNSILIVDDKPANLKALISLLAERNYQVRAAVNGPAALASARKAPPDLILLDIIMPDMDGFQVCERLKADERTRDIPIIFVSARWETEDKIKAFAMGGVDYVTKPFQAEEVLARVGTHLKLCHMQKQLKLQNEKLEQQNVWLQQALDSVKTLRGLIPICANCKKVRSDRGYWQQVEVYVQEHSDARFSHGICPDCMQELYSEYLGDEMANHRM